MSFDIFFERYRLGAGEPVQFRNPFTGEEVSAVPKEPLKDSELQAVRQVLKRANADGPDEFGCYVVRLGDGGRAEIFGKDLELGCMVCIRGITDDLLQLLFDLLKSAEWYMLPAMKDTMAIATFPANIGIPDDVLKVVVCNSAEELGFLLIGGVRDWQDCRDRVLGDQD